MSNTNSKIETIRSILTNISDKYENQIKKINENLVYKKWCFPGDYQKLLSITSITEKIQKYDLLEIDPRSIQDFIDEYNNKEWFKWFPVYNQAGQLSWKNDKDILDIIESFLKTGVKNNSQNIFKFINKDNNKLNIFASAIVWNKLDYIARIINKYSYKPKLFDGIYEDGNIIGSLARNNKDESLEIICLSNILSTIKSFISGKIENSDILGANTESLKASCNRQLNRIDIKNIITIEDFWNANVGKHYSKGFEELSSQKELQEIKNEQKIIENEMINAMKSANFSNAIISVCNMSQTIAGSILAIGNSNSIKLSQTCNQTNSSEIDISEKVNNITNSVTEYIEKTDKTIKEINNNVNISKNTSIPVVLIDYSNKIESLTNKCIKKIGNIGTITVSAIVCFIILVVISLLITFSIKFIKKNNLKNSIKFLF